MLHLDRAWERPLPTPEQRRHDVWTGLVATVLGVVSLELYRSAANLKISGHDALAFGLFAACGLVLCLRRRFPLTMLVGQSALFIVIGERQPELGLVFTVQMTLFASLYTAWAWSRRTRGLYLTTTAVLVAMFGWLVWQFVHDVPASSGAPHEGLLSPYWATVVYSLAINVVYFFGAMAWGHVAWRSARQRAEIADQHERERLAELRQREGALRAERVRIARDLHDVVAHHVSGIGVQATGAARVIDADPEAARRAIGTIETSARTAVTQMHQLVGLLRDDTEERDGRAPQPGLADLHRVTAPGRRPAIGFRQVGEPFDVPPTVQLSLFRVAQEAVANIVRHAPQADSGTVTLRYLDESDRAVEVEVIDDGRTAAPPPATSGGYGLTGIRERAAMHGGSCEIGPRPTGGFRVRVRIPVD